MFEVLEASHDRIVYLRVDGKLLHRDYEQLVPALEALLEEHRSIRCLLEMTGFEGIELRALWDELRFDTRHGAEIERVAVVGNRAWEKWMTKLSRVLFPNAELRYFDVAKREAAEQWIEQGLDPVEP